MGNSTGSTMYMFGAVIVIYIVSGISVAQEKERTEKRRRIQKR